MVAGPAHGTDDEDEVRRLHRADPPRAAVRWVEEALGDATIESVSALRGGVSAAMHLLTARDAGGGDVLVVLRRYLRQEQRAERPSPALLEAHALEHVAAAPLPTPTLLACDPDGSSAGDPAVLMSHFPGRSRWDARDRWSWAHELADIIVTIHGLGLPEPGAVRRYAPYRQRCYEPPRWAPDRRVWEEAAELLHAHRVHAVDRFIHRDFHPGNLLWKGRYLTGVVDWESACVGPPSVDVGHCRLNLLFETPELADDLVRAWEGLSGDTFDPWADVAAIVGVLDDLREQPPAAPARRSLHEALARAVADIG